MLLKRLVSDMKNTEKILIYGTFFLTILSIELDKYWKWLNWCKLLLNLKAYLDVSVISLFKIYAFKQKLGIRNISSKDCS